MDPAARRTQSGGAEDADLLRAAQGGDQAAFTEFVRRYQRAVYRVAWALTRNASDADDLAQETFVRAYQAIGRFRVGEPPYPWLARIATNLAFSLFRRRKRRPETPLSRCSRRASSGVSRTIRRSGWPRTNANGYCSPRSPS